VRRHENAKQGVLGRGQLYDPPVDPYAPVNLVDPQTDVGVIGAGAHGGSVTTPAPTGTRRPPPVGMRPSGGLGRLDGRGPYDDEEPS
jgi:hypothetical protein